MATEVDITVVNLNDDDARDVAIRVYAKNPNITNKAIAQAVGRSEPTVSPWLKDLRAKHDMAQDVKIFKMAILGIPQERIAARLGMPRDTLQDHLVKTSELKKSPNELLTKGFSPNTIGGRQALL